jgi:hypothetical protein
MDVEKYLGSHKIIATLSIGGKANFERVLSYLIFINTLTHTYAQLASHTEETRKKEYQNANNIYLRTVGF